jgi:hypothetical protein
MQLQVDECNRLKLDIKDFEQWLNSKDDGIIVGYCRTSNNCPIARYVRHITQGTVQVGHDLIKITTRWRDHIQSRIYDLPIWASQFIDTVDSMWSISGEITKEQAISALTSVKARL